MSCSAPAAFAEMANWSAAAPDETSPQAADRIFKAMFTFRHTGLDAAGRHAESEDLAGLSDAAVLGQFESLGDNCEFGIVQKTRGARAGGLLSFARTPPDVLADILRADFDGVSDPSFLRLAERPVDGDTEYLLINDRYGIVYHIVGDAARAEPQDLVRAETKRLAELEIALRDKLTRGEHIFVMKCNDDLSDDEARDVLKQLTRYGSNALLYVVQADAAHPEGSVVRVDGNLYRGHIERFAPYGDAYDTRIAAWTTICRAALSLHRAQSTEAAYEAALSV